MGPNYAGLGFTHCMVRRGAQKPSGKTIDMKPIHSADTEPSRIDPRRRQCPVKFSNRDDQSTDLNIIVENLSPMDKALIEA